MSTAPAALELRGLWRKFGDKIAVAGIDLVVPAGSFYGLVGPNGAGKTTTLSMATGLLQPDFGTVLVHGHDLWAAPVEVKAMLGVLPDGVRLFDRLTGEQLITYAGLLQGLDRATVAERATDLLAALDLTADAQKLVVEYSAGMTKKVALACALVHAPRLLVLDEPFEAVDPVSARTIRGILEDFAATGGTVVLPPTRSRKRSSRLAPARTSSRVPEARTTPAAMIATSVQIRSTRSITWLERTTVPPVAAKSSRMPRMVRAETGSTASNGSSRTSRRGAWMRAHASVIFLVIPAE